MDIDFIINRKELSERIDGDMDLFNEIAGLFFVDSVELLERIENAVKKSDPEELRKASHALKGAVANFSAPEAVDAALTMEKIARNREMEKAEETLLRLKKEISALKDAIEYLKKNASI